MAKRLPYGSLLILGLVLLSTEIFAQQSIGYLFQNNKEKADAMFEDLYYSQAIMYYKMALKKDAGNSNLMLDIANSYRLLGDYDASLVWYDSAFGIGAAPTDSLHYLYYGDNLVTAGRYSEADKVYETFWKKAPTDSRTSRKLAALDNLTLLFRDSATVSLAPLPFNTKYAELAAEPFKKGVIFLSSRPTSAIVDEDFLREESLFDLFYTEYNLVTGWSVPYRLPNGLNSNYFEGPVSINAEEKEMVLSRSNIALGKPILNSEGKTQMQLFSASRIGDEWVVGKKLSFCDSEYSFAHPALNVSGDTLYFASDMDGGFGGLDIYMSVLNENNEWGEPVNMGYMINTEGNEEYPFFIDDRLFFASNGMGGVGGMDVFKTYLERGHVQNVVNLGYPINSPYDDFAYWIDAESLGGMVSSNRIGGTGSDDIYSFTTEARVLIGRVIQEQDSSVIVDADVELLSAGQIVSSTHTGNDGRFNFYLPLGTDFEVRVSKQDHRASVPVVVPKHQGEIDLDTLTIALHKHDLFARGRILNNETQELMSGVRVVLHDATTNAFDTLVTDLNGTYSFVLEPMKNYDIWATKAGFLFGDATINTHELVKGVILNDIVLELEYEKKSVVHFDFDKYNLKKDAIAILARVAQAMTRTNSMLVISAFADARGTKEYNQNLSDKRAKAVKDYFTSHGIDASRIIARGFGETLILNRCVDGVNCEEVEHSKNRRAEIKIEGSNVK